MEDNCEDELFYKLCEKRRMLSELRDKVIMAREKNKRDILVNHGEGEQQNSNISILKTSQNQNAKESNNNISEEIIRDDLVEDFNWSLANKFKKTPNKTVISDELEGNLDFDSDDSVKDKNYDPNKDDNKSSCSEISNSPEQTISTRVYQVKRRIFSPEKLQTLHDKKCQLPVKRHNISSLSENEAPVNFDNGSELITLEDLIGSTNESSDSVNNYFLPPIKKPCLETVVSVNVDTKGYLSSDSDNEENYILPQQSKFCKALVVHKPKNNVIADASTKNVVDSSGVDLLNYDTNTPIYGILTVDNNGTIYLPNSINNNNTQETGINSSYELEISQKVKKKVVNPAKWKKNACKLARLQGSPYHSTVAKKKPDVEGRMLKAPCSCKARCYLKIHENQRLLIFNQFWKQCKSWDQRRQFIVSTVKKTQKRLMKTVGNLESDRRKYTYTYSFTIGNFSEKVCKVMYLNTLSIGEKFVKVSIDKLQPGGLTIEDQRGKHVPGNKSPELMIKKVIDHIKSYPSYESHYSRQKSEKKYLGPDLNIASMYAHYKILMQEENTPLHLIAKECIYRNIFNTKFNLSFKLPSLDTCDDCDAYQSKLKDTIDESERKQIEEEYEVHTKLSEERYSLKKRDKEDAKNSSGKKKVLMFDLQKCLATPNLTNTKSFYLRKLWTLNFTIYNATENTATNLLWSENISGRGGNEIASCLLRWANENKQKIETVEELTFWSDNCAGQNRNFMVVSAYIWLLHQFPNLKVINHKFMLKGHTHMEVDQIHSQIEKKKKQLKTMQIAIPRDWSQFIRTCGGRRNFDVFDMSLSNFKDLTALYKKNGPLVQRKKNTEGIEFKISECVFLQLKQHHPGILYYKTNFSDEFSEISFVRNASRGVQLPVDLPCIRQEEKPISSAKYKDLINLLQWVPQEFHGYYKNLKHSANESDFPEAD